MKVIRAHFREDADPAIHVWPLKYTADGMVGIAAGGLFNHMSAHEARELAEALYFAAAESEKAREAV